MMLVLALAATLAAACSSRSMQRFSRTPQPAVSLTEPSVGEHTNPPPTLPSTITLPELVQLLYSEDEAVRIQAAQKIAERGKEADAAVPALVSNLVQENVWVRQAAAEALGAIGAGAEHAVPSLVRVLLGDEWVGARKAAAIALGQIGEVGAVPFLALALGGQKYDTLPILSARAIAQLTGNQFPDSEPGPHGYQLNEDGQALIVLAAREWWEKEGKYQEWPGIGCD